MANKSTQARVRHRDGEMTLQQQETDSPIIPIGQLERLQRFKPEAVDWIIQQTQIEAEERRRERRRLNTLLFVERTLGQFFALVIGLAGIGGGAYIALQNQPWAGATIASMAITGLAVVFLTGRIKR